MKAAHIQTLWGAVCDSVRSWCVWCPADSLFSLLLSLLPRRESAQRRRLTKPLSNCQGAQRQQMAFDKVYHWQCVASQSFRFYTHTFSHIHTHTNTRFHVHPIEYSSRHKRGKTCRHGRLSKQLQQIETKLNLKPRATAATEHPWQIWQGRKGGAAGPKVEGTMERKAGVGHRGRERESSSDRWESKAEVGQRAALAQETSGVKSTKI